mgnify:CR=1 FL=1
MDIDMPALGRRLLQARLQRGLNQSELARRADLHRPTLLHLEHGTKRYLRADSLYRLAIALDVSIDWLLGIPYDAHDSCDAGLSRR